MTDGTTKRYKDGKVLFGVLHRRRWTPEENVRIVEETDLPGMSVSLVHQTAFPADPYAVTSRR